MLKKYLPAVWIVSKTEIDNVTKTEDIVFFISKTKKGLQPILKSFSEVAIIQEGN